VTADVDPTRSREAFVDAAAGDRPAVVPCRFVLDVDTTPLAAFDALAGASEHAFLLESAEKVASSDPDGAFRPASDAATRHARYSFVGYDPAAAVTLGPDGDDVRALADPALADQVADSLADASGEGLPDRMRAALPDVRVADADGPDRQHLDGGLVGYTSYEAVYDLHLAEVGRERPDSRVPDAAFLVTTRTVAFDDATGEVALVCTPVLESGDDAGAAYDACRAEADRVADALAAAGPEPPAHGGFTRTAETAGDRETYEDGVRAVKEHVRDGDVYQCVLSRTRELYGDVDPVGLYEALRDVNPSPYMYLLRMDGRSVVGASPETLVSVRDGEVMMNPIAGTCERGPSPVEDRRLAGEMLADEKERAEHTMLVDLARNDVRRVSAPGSVRVDEFMNVLKYSHVQHIESTVTGALADDADAVDAIEAALPAGTLSGAPKVRAMEVIDDLEATPRGLYGGGVGYVSWSGDADTAIVIRTATVEADAETPDGDRADRITVRAGAGIVADSDPESEYDETEQKMGGVLDAIERIETGAGDDETTATAAPADDAGDQDALPTDATPAPGGDRP
jgi:anthranilate synthase component 1